MMIIVNIVDYHQLNRTKCLVVHRYGAKFSYIMNNKMNIHKLEKIGFYVTVVFASIVITLGFLALVGKVVMSIFN